MFVTTESYYEELNKWVKEKPVSVQLSTFGIWASILENGKDLHLIGGKYKSPVHELFDQLNETAAQVDILVGLSDFKSCKDKGKTLCQDCLETYNKGLLRLFEHAKKWPKFNWKFSNALHLKCLIFNYQKEARIMIGGRNLSGSEWLDLSLELPQTLNLATQELFDKQWNSSISVTEGNLASFAEHNLKKQFIVT